MNMLVQKCDRCGKQVVIKSHHESTDMVHVPFMVLYLCDLKEGETVRPHLFEVASPDKPLHYCLSCLQYEIQTWVQRMKDRGDSEIPPENVSFPESSQYKKSSP